MVIFTFQPSLASEVEQIVDKKVRCGHVPFPVSNNANNDADSSSFCISVTSIGSIAFSGNQAFNSDADSGGLVSRLLGSRRDRNLKSPERKMKIS